MIALGIRIEPKVTRYALVKSEGTGYELINACGESQLFYPADMDAPEEKGDWLYRELERILQEYPDIKKVCIKVPEFTSSHDQAQRETFYLVGVTLLFCYRKDIPVTTKIYRSLHTNSKKVKNHAENRVGSRTKPWDVSIADAVVAALSGCPGNA